VNRQPPDGSIIFVRHYRWGYIHDPEGDGPFVTRGLYPANTIRAHKGIFTPRGGKTEVTVILPDKRTATGIAHCMTIDTFNKNIGRQIALGRALFELANDERSIARKKRQQRERQQREERKNKKTRERANYA
jgi:hypothetical protein